MIFLNGILLNKIQDMPLNPAVSSNEEGRASDDRPKRGWRIVLGSDCELAGRRGAGMGGSTAQEGNRSDEGSWTKSGVAAAWTLETRNNDLVLVGWGGLTFELLRSAGRLKKGQHQQTFLLFPSSGSRGASSGRSVTICASFRVAAPAASQGRRRRRNKKCNGGLGHEGHNRDRSSYEDDGFDQRDDRSGWEGHINDRSSRGGDEEKWGRRGRSSRAWQVCTTLSTGKT